MMKTIHPPHLIVMKIIKVFGDLRNFAAMLQKEDGSLKEVELHLFRNV